MENLISNQVEQVRKSLNELELNDIISSGFDQLLLNKGSENYDRIHNVVINCIYKKLNKVNSDSYNELLSIFRGAEYNTGHALKEFVDNSIAADAQNMFIKWNNDGSEIYILDDGNGIDISTIGFRDVVSFKRNKKGNLVYNVFGVGFKAATAYLTSKKKPIKFEIISWNKKTNKIGKLIFNQEDLSLEDPDMFNVKIYDLDTNIGKNLLNDIIYKCKIKPINKNDILQKKNSGFYVCIKNVCSKKTPQMSNNYKVLEEEIRYGYLNSLTKVHLNGVLIKQEKLISEEVIYEKIFLKEDFDFKGNDDFGESVLEPISVFAVKLPINCNGKRANKRYPYGYIVCRYGKIYGKNLFFARNEESTLKKYKDDNCRKNYQIIVNMGKSNFDFCFNSYNNKKMDTTYINQEILNIIEEKLEKVGFFDDIRMNAEKERSSSKRYSQDKSYIDKFDFNLNNHYLSSYSLVNLFKYCGVVVATDENDKGKVSEESKFKFVPNEVGVTCKDQCIYIISMKKGDKEIILKIGRTDMGIVGRMNFYQSGTPEQRRKGSCSTTNFNVSDFFRVFLPQGYEFNVYMHDWDVEPSVINCFGVNLLVKVSTTVYAEMYAVRLFLEEFKNKPWLLVAGSGTKKITLLEGVMEAMLHLED